MDITIEIIKWWNNNAFLGYIVQDIKDIKFCLNEYNNECEYFGNKGFDSIEDMIEYYQNQTELEIDYYKEIKDRGLKCPKFIDNFLKNI